MVGFALVKGQRAADRRVVDTWLRRSGHGVVTHLNSAERTVRAHNGESSGAVAFIGNIIGRIKTQLAGGSRRVNDGERRVGRRIQKRIHRIGQQ